MIEPGEVLARTGGQELGRIIHHPAEIAARVEDMGREITGYYPSGEDLLVLGLLKGSFIFIADLVRAILRPIQVDFLVAASYGAGTTSPGRVKLLYQPEGTLAGRNVLLVEDIIDSGTTLNELVPWLRERGPESIEMCALLRKRSAAPLALEPRWTGFDAPDDFMIGYGLDHSEDFRNLPFLASLRKVETRKPVDAPDGGAG